MAGVRVKGNEPIAVQFAVSRHDAIRPESWLDCENANTMKSRVSAASGRPWRRKNEFYADRYAARKHWRPTGVDVG